MTDRDHELLSRYLDGELTQAQEEEVAKELIESPEYCEELNKLRSLHNLSEEVYPMQEFRYKKPVKRRLPRLAPLAAALALTCILAGVGYAALSGGLFEQGEDSQEATTINSPTIILEPESDEITESSIAAEPQTAPDEEPEDSAIIVAGVAPRTINGTVHNYDGEPIAGARVATPNLETSTDKNGEFSIPFPDGYSYDVEVARLGYSSVRFRVQPNLIDAEIDLKVKLNPKVDIQGRVVDELNRPISGARVTPYRGRTNSESAISNKDGEYTLGVSSADENWLWVEHSDYAAMTGVIQTDGRVADVVLKRGGSLRVSVLEKGIPLEGIQVIVRKLEKERFKELTAYTDADGYAWFAQIPIDQDYTVRAVKRDGDEDHQWIRVTKDQQAECTVRFESEFVATLTGRVTGEDASPITDARITVTEDDSPDRWRTAHTDENGRYLMKLTPGHKKIGVSTSQSQYKNVEIDVKESGGEFKRNFRFEALEPLTLSLASVNGNPTESVLLRSGISVYSSDDSVQGWTRIPNGILRLDSLIGTSNLEVFDPVTGLINASRKYDSGDSESEQTSGLITLDQPAGAIVGRVITPTGEPVPGVRVFARTDTSQKAFWIGGTYSDSNGTFQIEPLRMNDEYRLWTERLGYIRESSLVKAKPGNEASPIALTMHLPDAEVSGRVVYPNGQPVPQAAISFRGDPNFNGAFGRADAKGIFSLKVRRGSYTLSADAHGVHSGEWPVQAPAANVQLVLPYPEGAISDPFHQLRSDYLKQLGLSFKMYSNESRGEKYPNLSPTVGAFLPTLSQIYPEYAPDQSILEAMRGEGGFPRMVYFGHAIVDADVASLFLDAYEDYGPAEISGSDLQTEPGLGSGGGSTIFVLREGIERFFITDINDPSASALTQAKIPLLWELPDPAREQGGWVLYLDGHTEYVEYPGKYPMDESVIERVRALMQGR